MEYKNRDGEIVKEETRGEKVASFLYGTKLGRLMIKPLISPGLQRFLGAILDSRISVGLAVPYKNMHHIDMDLYKSKFYSSFNSFFTREIKLFTVFGATAGYSSAFMISPFSISIVTIGFCAIIASLSLPKIIVNWRFY
mgnify:CR=1 FL=1